MARPTKQGIDFFPMDVDMFRDRKIKRLLRAVGGKGYTVYIYLLTEIYREEGYFLEWDKDSAFDVSDDLNFTENLVEETINACCSVGLFDKELLDNGSVLSSESIQRRWKKIVTDARRTNTEIAPEYNLLDKGLELTPEETELSRGETPATPEETPEKGEESTQSKVKESKVENTTPVGTEDPDEEEVKFPEDSHPYQLSEYLLGKILEYKPSHRFSRRPPDLQKWALEADRMHRLDGRGYRDAAKIIKWIFDLYRPSGDFDWRDNIQSTKKLRDHYDRLESQSGIHKASSIDAILDSLYQQEAGSYS